MITGTTSSTGRIACTGSPSRFSNRLPRPIGSVILKAESSEANRVIGTGIAFDAEAEVPTADERLVQARFGRFKHGLVVVEEVQRKPELFPLLRVLSDRRPLPARFLLLGSASPDLIRNSSDSLAGRVALVNMAGYGLADVGPLAGRASGSALLSAGPQGGGGVHRGAAGEFGSVVTRPPPSEE